MEKEQIVKALKYCTNFTPSSCDNCPFVPKGDCYKGSMGCNDELMKNALSLIREQDKRIEELEKEAAFWEGEADNAVDIAAGNIRAEIASGGTSCHWCENKIKADTVRKMQKMLKEKAVDVDMDDATLWMSCVSVDDIDQIAKQLTEDKS